MVLQKYKELQDIIAILGMDELSDEDKLRSRQSATAFSPDWTEDKTYAHRCADRAIRFLQENRGTF